MFPDQVRFDKFSTVAFGLSEAPDAVGQSQESQPWPDTRSRPPGKVQSHNHLVTNGLPNHLSSDASNTAHPSATGLHADGGDEQESEPSASIRWIKRALPVVFLVVVSVFAIRELHSLDIHAVRTVLGSLSLPHLAIIQSVALTGVLAMCLYDWRAARAFDLQIAPRTLIHNAWIANTFNNLIGLSGLAGSGIRMLLMTHDRIDPRRAALFSALIMVSVPVGLAVLSWPLLLSGGPGMDRLPIPTWAAWLALGAFATYLPVYLLLLTRGAFAAVLRGLAPQSLHSLAVLIAVSTLDWLLAATAAWIALDFSGAAIPWSQFLAGFVLASTLGILSLIPGGLGVFDTALVILLSPFAPGPEQIVSGVLVYRLCYYLVPWLIAVYLGADKLMLTERWQRVALAHAWGDSRIAGFLRLPLNLLTSLGVRVLAYLTFGSGVVLLASAAFPTLTDRFVVLHRYVPLAATEISHVLSVAAGVLLIALSRGIAGQVRSAYHLTQVAAHRRSDVHLPQGHRLRRGNGPDRRRTVAAPAAQPFLSRELPALEPPQPGVARRAGLRRAGLRLAG